MIKDIIQAKKVQRIDCEKTESSCPPCEGGSEGLGAGMGIGAAILATLEVIASLLYALYCRKTRSARPKNSGKKFLISKIFPYFYSQNENEKKSKYVSVFA